MNAKLIISTLQCSPIFKNMSGHRLNEISKEFKEVVYHKHDTIDYRQIDKYFYVVASGNFKMMHTDTKSGKSIALFLYACGDVFDILTLFDGKEHDVEFLATNKSIVFSVTIKQMRKWIVEYPEINKAFFRYFADKMRELEKFSESLAFCDTKTRLAQLILKHADKSYPLKDEPISVRLINNLTHESLAELIGSVRSVVTTEINKLKKEGIVIMHNGSLAIKDLEQLQKKCRCLHR